MRTIPLRGGGATATVCVATPSTSRASGIAYDKVTAELALPSNPDPRHAVRGGLSRDSRQKRNGATPGQRDNQQAPPPGSYSLTRVLRVSTTAVPPPDAVNAARILTPRRFLRASNRRPAAVGVSFSLTTPARTSRAALAKVIVREAPPAVALAVTASRPAAGSVNVSVSAPRRPGTGGARSGRVLAGRAGSDDPTAGGAIAVCVSFTV